MSELQTALLAVGIVVIVAVFAFNKWQEAKYRRDAERSFSVRHEDALVVDREVTEAGASQAPSRVEGELAERTEPGLENVRVPIAVRETAPALAAINLVPGMDCPAIDYCVDFGAKAEIIGSRVIGCAVRLLADFTKAVHLECYDPESRTWKNLAHASQYSVFRGRIQLVDRRGAISSDELRRFDDSVRVIAREIGAVSYEADVLEGIQRAKDWDAFCAEVDVQVGLNVVAEQEPFSGAQVDQSSTALGADLGLDGAYHFRDLLGQTKFRLLNLDSTPFAADSLLQLTTPAVTFEIDVPRSMPAPDLADALFETAGRFAERVGGKVVDDNQVVVSSTAISSIRLQLQSIHAAMQSRGCPAGHAMALRLFS